jgi:hypothetical protein
MLAIANLTEEEKTEMLHEAQEEARLAAAWRAEHRHDHPPVPYNHHETVQE